MSTLSPGARLGPYEVVGRLGAGGMGEVWRAKDPRLGRDVAIKVLPELFAADPERLARFQREAHVLAALNHANIAAIYGLEELGTAHALVLELVEGETLAQRIASGPIPVDEALQIAKQIAAALEIAHEQGIIHRDLKPANIIVTRAGVVKVLDFGLAKLTEAAPAASGRSELSQSPTLTSPVLATNAGMLLGTAAYMSPEQARGRDADRRADIWAFGCVLYEMLTGKQAFAGETVTDVLAAVVMRELDVSLLPAQTPAGVRWLLTRCLQKDPRQRFRDAADAAALLDLQVPTTATTVTAPAPASRRAWTIAVVAGVVAVAALSALAFTYRGAGVPATEPMALQIEVAGAPPNQLIALSPDGKRLVYTAVNNGQPALWVRALDDLAPHLIPGVIGVEPFSMPFWSPDGRYLAFASEGKLKKIDPGGGIAETLTDLDSQFGGGTWGRDGTILFAGNGHGLRSVAAAGGAVTDVTVKEPRELFHDCPWFLPDGRHYLYLAYSSQQEASAIYLGELGSTSRTKLIPSATCASYASGYIVAPRESSLFAWRFDPDALTLSGDAIPLAKNVATFASGEVASFGVSGTGVLIYRGGVDEASNRRLVWFDRTGRAGEPIGPPVRTGNIQLSPEGTRVAYPENAGAGGNEDVWVYDLTSGVKTRLTNHAATDHNPVWSSDGRRIFFDSHRDIPPTVYVRVADGATPEEPFVPGDKTLSQSPRAISPDGRYLLLGKSPTGSAPWHIWLQPISPGGAQIQYLPQGFDQVSPVVSPDSRWVAYATNDSGRFEVFVQPLLNPSAGKWQISTNGGRAPRWGRGGRELYFLADNGNLMAVSVNAGTTFSVGASASLFRTPFGANTVGVPYDTHDGERFLVSLPSIDQDAQPMTALINWTATLKALMGP